MIGNTSENPQINYGIDSHRALETNGPEENFMEDRSVTDILT